ncbi:putative reverse transcriptase domain-containing protein [Tanacetum coccineum]
MNPRPSMETYVEIQDVFDNANMMDKKLRAIRAESGSRYVMLKWSTRPLQEKDLSKIISPRLRVSYVFELADEERRTSETTMLCLENHAVVIVCDENDSGPEVYGERLSTISGETKEEHDAHLRLILELLKKEEFEGIHVDPAKIESIKDWESPKTPTEIRQFLGLAGYYRRFIKGFSKIAKPMTKLTQKSVKFNWRLNKEEIAFQTLKQKLCSAPILALPEGSENFIVYCDASHKGLGAMLMQKEKVEARKEENYGAEDLCGMIKNLEPRADGTLCLKNRNSKFTSHFWKSLNEALGTQLDMSMAYHPQTDGQSSGSSNVRRPCYERVSMGLRKRICHIYIDRFSYNNKLLYEIKAALLEAVVWSASSVAHLSVWLRWGDAR